jgi:hypothetical protein
MRTSISFIARFVCRWVHYQRPPELFEQLDKVQLANLGDRVQLRRLSCRFYKDSCKSSSLHAGEIARAHFVSHLEYRHFMVRLRYLLPCACRLPSLS